MKYQRLYKINKLYFGCEDISRALDITMESAKVSGARYVKQGILLRVKRNIYVLKERWKSLDTEDKFKLANLLQVPSYISLMTAMEYYGITTQVQRDYTESIAVKRTKEINIEEAVFSYTKIGRGLYFGFLKKKGFFIAEAEKALLDSLYLTSLKRYNFDLTSIDFSKLDKAKMKKFSRKFPEKVRRALKKWMT